MDGKEAYAGTKMLADLLVIHGRHQSALSTPALLTGFLISNLLYLGLTTL